MATAKDILLSKANVLRIEDGDFVVGESDGQHVRHLLFSIMGTWRQSPLVGVGIRRFLNIKASASTILSLRKEITVQMTDDGYRVNELQVTTGSFNIDYERTRP